MNRGSKRNKMLRILPVLILALLLTGCKERQDVADAYAVYDTTSDYVSFGTSVRGTNAGMFASNLCVGGLTNSTETFDEADLAETEAVFSVADGEVTYAKNIYTRRYPASTTKILTAYLAIKYGDLDQTVTVSENAIDSLTWDSSTCGLAVGDQVTLRDLLYGLMLRSGNDAANVIAETIAGSQEDFAALMNEEAAALGATQSHFVNAHGLSNEDHYTTAYDLYLIFSAALQYEEFVDVISADSYEVTIMRYPEETEDEEGESQAGASGEREPLEVTWENTNQYLNGDSEMPDGVRVIGGKTGTTNAAGSCLVLYSENAEGAPIISIVLASESHDNLYACMSGLLENFAN